MPIREWAERIVKALDDPDLGVALTATSVVTAMAQDDLEAFEGCYHRAVRRLDKIVFDADYPPEYVYYKVSILSVLSSIHQRNVPGEATGLGC